MIALGFGVLWIGYQQAIWGWCLLKGYDVRWRDLANPVHPYQWPPPGQPMPMTPPGEVLPSSAATTAAGGGPPPPPASYD